MGKNKGLSAPLRPEHALAASLESKLQVAFEFHQRGQSAQAEALYRAVLQQLPEQFRALHLLGLLYHQHGRHKEAADLIQKAVSVKPDYVNALNNLGVVLTELKRYDEALASYDQVLALDPGHLDAINNRGVVLKALSRNDEALSAYDHALSIQPNLADAHNNRGVVLQDLGRYDEALGSYARAITLKPNYAEAHWNESRCRLLVGDYARGWEKYEWRWQRANFTSTRRNFQQPLWLGAESLQGKTILLHAEQGLGDTIQFVRYVPMVLDRGASVVLEVQPGLTALFTKMNGVEHIIGKGEALPPFDFHCPLLSLPLAFKTELDSVPSRTPYIFADQSKINEWREKLGPKAGPRIGLVWSGNPNQQDNDKRSISLHALLGLSSGQTQLVSLQNELRTEEEQRLVETGAILHFGDELRDFSDTAALIENMDIVISVCTSVAHLAGAMGKPLWMLLQYAHDWRWLLDRDDSPWYPSAKLYRQSAPGDWDGVMARVKHDCAVKVAGIGTPRK